MAKTKIAVGNLGAEESAQLTHKVLTRAATRAQADALFEHKATGIAAENQKRLRELFVQAPAAETMAPTLAKTAGVSLSKLRKVSDPVVKARAYAKDSGHLAARGIARAKINAGTSRESFQRINAQSNMDVGADARRAARSVFPKQVLKMTGHQPPRLQEFKKTASIDYFFDKLSELSLTDAQRRYPELLKVAGPLTTPSPTLKRAKSAVATTSSLAGGAS